MHCKSTKLMVMENGASKNINNRKRYRMLLYVLTYFALLFYKIVSYVFVRL